MKKDMAWKMAIPRIAAVVRVLKRRGGTTGACFVKISLMAPATTATAPIAKGAIAPTEFQLVSPLLRPTRREAVPPMINVNPA